MTKSVPLLLAIALSPLGAQNPLEDLTFLPVATQLRQPVALTHAGDGSGRLFITLQDGQIRVSNGTQTYQTPFLDIRDRVMCCGELGLLSTAFHPNYENNGYFYVFYTNRDQPEPSSVLSRFQVSADDPLRAEPSSEEVMMVLPQPSKAHQAGQLQFGLDGYLYVATGDGGLDPRIDDPAQRLDNLYGKILRIDVDRGDPYGIPPGNPFVGVEGAREEIFLYGLRNPWRFSVDRETGDLFIGDVGAGGYEEVSFYEAGTPAGLHYGWAVWEGNSHCLFDNPRCGEPGFTPPILEYEHVRGHSHPFTADCGGSISGGYRYRGFEVPQIYGRYFYADFCLNRIWAASEEGGVWSANEPIETVHCLSAFGEDEDGELYLVDWLGGSVLRVDAPHPVPSISVMAPRGSVEGADQFRLTIAGEMFVPDSEVRWNGEPRPTEFINNQTLRATISADDLASPSATRISVASPEPGGGASAAVDFPVVDAPGSQPDLNPAGVVNAASFAAGVPIAPGSLISVFGSGLAVARESSAATPLPDALAGSSATFSADLRAAYVFGSDRQLNLQAPWELAAGEDVSLTVRVGGLESAEVEVTVAEVSPGIFTLDQGGAGQGAILIAGTALVAGPASLPVQARPATSGEFLEIFCTGLGAVEHSLVTGETAGRNRLNRTQTLPTVTIGGVEARVAFSGLAPGFAGLYQVNAAVPAGLPAEESVEVLISIGGTESNRVTIAVE